MVLSFALVAQEKSENECKAEVTSEDVKTDSVAKPATVMKVDISVEDLQKLNTEKDNAEKRYNALLAEHRDLESEADSLRKKLNTSTAFQSKAKQEIAVLKEKCCSLESFQEEAEKKLMNIATNFLYIPYEHFSVEKIAVPALKAIPSSDINADRLKKYNLVVNYTKDIQALAKAIDNSIKSLANPFASDNVLRDFQSQEFFLRYKEYADWKNTYLGNIFVNVEKILQGPETGKGKEAQLEILKKELAKCIKTIPEE